jgi:CAAX protease family protein
VNETGAPPYVGFWRRALAAFLDNATWLIFYAWLYGGVVAATYEESREAAGVLVLVYLSLWFNYFAFCEWRWGQTIGKNATGIEVVSLNGEKLSFGQASIRGLLRIVDFFVIGWVMIAATKRKQRLGDKAAKTVVLRRPSRAVSAAPAVRGAAESQTPEAEAPSPPPVPSAPPAPRANLPAVPWTPKDTAWGLIAGLILAVVVAPLLVLPFDPSLGDPDSQSTGGILAAQALLGATLLFVALGMATEWKFGRLREAFARLGLRRFQPSAIGWMFAVLFTYYVAAAIFATLVLTPEQEDIGEELGVCDPGVAVAVIAVLLVVVLAPLTEELFFRGFVFAGLRSRWSLWPAALVSGLLFGLVHAPTGPTAAIPLAGLGVGMAWLYDRTGSLWPCVGAHFVNNALAITIVVGGC